MPSWRSASHGLAEAVRGTQLETSLNFSLSVQYSGQDPTAGHIPERKMLDLPRFVMIQKEEFRERFQIKRSLISTTPGS